MTKEQEYQDNIYDKMVKSNQIYENLQSVKELRKLLMEYNKKFSTPILRGIASLSMASMVCIGQREGVALLKFTNRALYYGVRCPVDSDQSLDLDQ